jgi:putative phosphoesterase
MRILILSDIHANIEALEAIKETYDELWVLGDLVNYGPNPAEVIEFVRRNAALVVRGNHDHAVGLDQDPRCSAAFARTARAMQVFTAASLSAEQKSYLAQLPLKLVREIDGVRFTLCHAVPSEPLFRYCQADSPWWPPIAGDTESDVILVGHTHLPSVREFSERLVVNPGSVGQPKHGRAEACYAVWEDGCVALRAVPYPVEETVRKLLSLPVEATITQELASVVTTGAPPTLSRVAATS